MPTPNEEDLAQTTEIERIVRECAQRISEHTDSCLILVTKLMDSGSKTTWGFNHGTGNHFARYGQAREWIVQEEGMQSRRYTVPDDEDSP